MIVNGVVQTSGSGQWSPHTPFIWRHSQISSFRSNNQKTSGGWSSSQNNQERMDIHNDDEIIRTRGCSRWRNYLQKTVNVFPAANDLVLRPYRCLLFLLLSPLLLFLLFFIIPENIKMSRIIVSLWDNQIDLACALIEANRSRYWVNIMNRNHLFDMFAVFVHILN